MTNDSIDLLRIVDASINRVREGLRVAEDFVRFGLDDPFLSRLLKETRHELASIIQDLPQSRLLASRDTLGDVGTEIRTTSEYKRSSLSDVACASLKRVQEGLRSLEEFGKLVSTDVLQPSGRSRTANSAESDFNASSQIEINNESGSSKLSHSLQFEQLRYRLYTLEKAILRTQFNRSRLQQHNLYLLVTKSACVCELETTIRQGLSAGVSIFQIREKEMPDRDLVEHARQVCRWVRDSGGLVIINDRPDIAVLADADGVHLGQDDLSVRDARRTIGPDRIIGVSTHEISQARQAVLDGADYLGVGPTFPSGTKSFETFSGLDYIRQVAAEITLPWFAIGGITPSSLPEAVNAGTRRVAVSGVVLKSPNPGSVCQELSEILSTGKK